MGGQLTGYGDTHCPAFGRKRGATGTSGTSPYVRLPSSCALRRQYQAGVRGLRSLLHELLHEVAGHGRVVRRAEIERRSPMQHHFERQGEGKGIRYWARGRLGGHEGVEAELPGAPQSQLRVLDQDRHCERGICRSGGKSKPRDVLDDQAKASRDLAGGGRKTTDTSIPHRLPFMMLT